MRVPGWCTDCRKVRQVTSSGSNLVRGMAAGGVVEGLCDECSDRADERRLRSRRPAPARTR